MPDNSPGVQCTRCHGNSATASKQASDDFELLWKQTQGRLAEIPQLQEEVKALKESLEQATYRAEAEANRAALAESEARFPASAEPRGWVPPGPPRQWRSVALPHPCARAPAPGFSAARRSD